MARQVLETLVDDLDGSTAVETIDLRLDGTAYEIDLNAEHATSLRQVLAPFMAAARRAGARPAPASPRRPARAGGREETTQIREWARGNGFTVSHRGRIPGEVLEAYHNRTTVTATEPAPAPGPASAPEPAPELTLAPEFVSEAAAEVVSGSATASGAEVAEVKAKRARRSQKAKTEARRGDGVR